MSVHPKRFRKSKPVAQPAVMAKMVLNADHPLYQSFVKWLGGKEATKRKAREFLATYPQLREGAKAA